MKNGVVFFLLLMMAGCAGGPGAHHAGRGRSSHEPPVKGNAASESTPERRASNDYLEQGQRVFNGGAYDRAADLFQEAVTVDPTNGAGYYFLALVKTKTGEYGEAAEFLEKAEALLPEDSEYKEKSNQLKEELQK